MWSIYFNNDHVAERRRSSYFSAEKLKEAFKGFNTSYTFTYSHKRFFMLKSFYLTLIDASDQLGVSIVPMFGKQTSNLGWLDDRSPS